MAKVVAKWRRKAAVTSSNHPGAYGATPPEPGGESSSAGQFGQIDARPKDFLLPAGEASDVLSLFVDIGAYVNFRLDNSESRARLAYKASRSWLIGKTAALFKGSAQSIEQ
jgi:hypothetical protein